MPLSSVRKIMMSPVFQVEGLGNFQFRRPTLRDEIRIDVMTQRLIQGQTTVSPVTRATAEIIATIEVAAVQKPEGEPWYDLYDYTPLFELYKEYQEWLKSFREPVDNGDSGGAGISRGDDV